MALRNIYTHTGQGGLIPGSIYWLADKDAPIQTPSTGVVDMSAPRKTWRDNSLVVSQAYAWWNPPPPLSGMKTYRTLAFNPDGSLALTPIESPQCAATYGYVLHALREFAFAFPEGIPYLREFTIPAAQAAALNYVAGPPTPVPMEMPSDSLLVRGPDGQWMVVQYQEFGQMVKPPAMSDDQKLGLVDKIRASGIPAAHQILQIRLALQDTFKPVVI